MELQKPSSRLLCRLVLQDQNGISVSTREMWWSTWMVTLKYKQLFSDWLPWGMKRRDLLLRCYWRREDDGTYVILYHSVFHKKCPPQKGYVRACLKSGGYVISPVNKGKQSVVKHMLAIDWKCWRSYPKSSSAHSITIRMLGRVAALRELFKARLGNCSSSHYSSGELTRNSGLHIKEGSIFNSDTEIQVDENNNDNSVGEVDQTQSELASPVALNDADDEFYDVPEPSDSDVLENGWMTECSHQKSEMDDEVEIIEDLLPEFHNLITIEFSYSGHSRDWLEVLKVLKHCPKLQNLFIDQDESSLYGREWQYPLYAPKCISSHLKTCRINGYSDNETEFEFARYIMQNARLLQDMTICIYYETNEREKHEMIKKLSLCTRSSSICKLSFSCLDDNDVWVVSCVM